MTTVQLTPSTGERDGPDRAAEEDRSALRAALRRFLTAHVPEQKTLGLLEDALGHDPADWTRLTRELGITALAVPTGSGGLGCGWREFRVVLEELGRVVYPGPFFSTLLATRALTQLGDADDCHGLLERVGGGTALTLVAGTGRHLADTPICTRAGLGDAAGTWHVVGAGRAIDARSTSGFLVLAETPDGPALFAVDGANSGVCATARPTMDLTRRLCDVSFHGARATRLSRRPIRVEAIRALMAEASLALAAEQIGGARRALETTVDHARMRYQFGRPVGSFQAVKHRLADLLVLVESGDAACSDAIQAVDDGRPDATRAVHLAAAICAETYLACARAMVQLHGGIGFTWEHPAHLHLKRARSSSLLFGSTRYHRRAVAAQLGLLP
jgi:alkylation response protein AidB-like acyl-CoA dehydrogenase